MSVLDLLRPDLHGRTPYGAPQLNVPVQLNTNENAYPVPEAVVRDIVADLAGVAAGLNRYPDRDATDLRADLAAYLRAGSDVDVQTPQVWAGNGSNEVLLHLVQAFGGSGRRALGFTPSYSMHPIISRTAGTTWIDGRRGDGGDGRDGGTDPFTLSAGQAVEQIRRHDPHLVFLCSPNNPTGTALDLSVVEAVHDGSGHAVVIVDEAYAEFARAGTPSALELLAGRDRLVVTRTMSKAFALAGARLGYLAGSADLVDALRLVRLPYHLSTPTQVVARAALRHADLMLGTVEAIKSQRDRMVTELTAMGLRTVPSDANFVLFGGLADEGATWRALLEAGVLVRDVGLRHHLRVTAGTPQETTRFLQAVRDLVDTHLQERA
ncbi:MAG TPA: histidinol-phosphate transaminase [Dermatophilaceae bacterium]|nr:histidinol-phosphate transaminase [Dermatophilaceae bacterium]